MENEQRYKMALEAVIELVKADTNSSYTVIAAQCKNIAEKALGLKDVKEPPTP